MSVLYAPQFVETKQCVIMFFFMRELNLIACGALKISPDKKWLFPYLNIALLFRLFIYKTKSWFATPSVSGINLWDVNILKKIGLLRENKFDDGFYGHFFCKGSTCTPSLHIYIHSIHVLKFMNVTSPRKLMGGRYYPTQQSPLLIM